MSESEYDPLQKERRLWNDSESIMSDSMAGIVMMHRNLVYLDNFKAVLRRDYNKMSKKVRIVGGGSMIDGPMYAGFVGPGMLTAAVLGLPENSDAGVPSTDSIFNVIHHLSKDGQEQMNEVFVLVHECLEYFLNFMEAKKKAEETKIPLKVLFVRDEVNFKLSQKPSSPRSPSGLLLLYKIAGAMSEAGRTLTEIYHQCDEIMKAGIISSIGLYIEKTPKEISQVQICRGDRLSDRDSKRFPVAGSTTKKIVETLMVDLINGNEYHKFPKESQLAVMLDYFGGFSELEASIVMKEFLQLSNRYKYKIELILTGTFRTSMEIDGFHLSIFNVSCNQEFLYYLKEPTVAFSWPKTSIREVSSPLDKKIQRYNSKEETVLQQNGTGPQIVAVESTSHQNDYQIKHSPEKPNNHQSKDEMKLSKREKEKLDEVELQKAEILLTAIEYACEALIACAQKIDALDISTPSNFERCGTRLANIASIIKSAIHEKHFADSSSCNIIFQLAMIFDQALPDPQAELYSIFFNVIGQAIEDEECLETKHWLEAFIAANTSMDEVTGGSKISDTLYAATSAFCNTYSKFDSDVIHPLGLAVNAAQNETSNVNIENLIAIKNFKDIGFSGLAGSHALGIWMRGAYEGIKLKSSRLKAQRKRLREDDDDDIEVEDFERISKIQKVSLDRKKDEDDDSDEDEEDDDDYNDENEFSEINEIDENDDIQEVDELNEINDINEVDEINEVNDVDENDEINEIDNDSEEENKEEKERKEGSDDEEESESEDEDEEGDDSVDDVDEDENDGSDVDIYQDL